MNLSVQYFLIKNYKREEIYGDKIPIRVTNLKILDDFIQDRLVKFIPLKDGYRLEIKPTVGEQLLEILFKKELLKFAENRLFPYNKVIKTEYFQFKIEKIKDITQPIYLKLNGDTYYIYETLIKNKLSVGQKNKNAPIIDIVYQDNIPERATEYINRLIVRFRDEGRIEKSKRNNQISEFIQKELAKNSKELKDAEKALERYRVDNKAIKISTQTDLIIKTLNNIEISISDNHLKNMMIDNIIYLAQHEPLGPVGKRVPGGGIGANADRRDHPSGFQARRATRQSAGWRTQRFASHPYGWFALKAYCYIRSLQYISAFRST
jgi:hypothetical protein